MKSGSQDGPVTRLQETGWLLVQGLLSEAQLARMHAAWDTLDRADNQSWELAGRDEFSPCAESPVLRSLLPVLLGPAYRLQVLKGRSPKAGQGLQGLHVDTVGPVSPDRQQLVNAFWILDRMSRDNGATRLVPGSHRSYSVPEGSYAQPEGKHPDARYIEANPGDLLLFSAHLWHGGSRNVSGDRRRVVIAQFERSK